MEQILDQPTNPQPKPKMPLMKVLLFNFGTMIFYMALTGTAKGEAGLGNLMADAALITVQVGLNLLVGLIMLFKPETKPAGAALMIGGLIMGAIGFGACVGKAAIFG